MTGRIIFVQNGGEAMAWGGRAVRHPNCPRCGMEFVQRVPRKNWLEGLGRLLAVHPFRCQLCSHRFLTLDWWPRLDFYRRRQYVRMPARFPLTFTSRQAQGEGTVVNLSIKGCQLETDAPLPPDGMLSLDIRGTDGQPLFAVSTAVVRTIEGNQAGIEFLRIKNEQMDRLVGVMLYLYTGVKKEPVTGTPASRTPPATSSTSSAPAE